MRQSRIPLWIGLTGLLLFEAACTDSPGPPTITQPMAHVEITTVLVRNTTDRPVPVSLDVAGRAVGIGWVDGGSTELFQIPAVGSLVRFVATASAHGEIRVSEFVFVAPGRSIAISVTEAGLDVDDGDGRSELCERHRELCEPF